MAYGFTTAEEQSLDEIKQCLKQHLSDDYNINDYAIGGFVGYPKVSTTRPRIVKDLINVLSTNGFTIGDVVETRESQSPYTFIRVGDVSINVGAAKRGGQGIFPATIKTMEQAITTTQLRADDKRRQDAMKDRIRSKLDPDEIAFLGL